KKPYVLAEAQLRGLVFEFLQCRAVTINMQLQLGEFIQQGFQSIDSDINPLVIIERSRIDKHETTVVSGAKSWAEKFKVHAVDEGRYLGRRCGSLKQYLLPDMVGDKDMVSKLTGSSFDSAQGSRDDRFARSRKLGLVELRHDIVNV